MLFCDSLTLCKKKFELMLRPMSYASDLDDLHKSQWTRDLGLVPTRYSYYGAQGGGSRARLSMRGNSHKGLVFGDTRWGVQELKLRVQVSTGYYLYTNGVNSNTRFEPC